VMGCVVEVGPKAVRGPCHVAPDLVSTALDCIGDDMAILDDQPVAVTAVWREVFRTVLPERVDTAVLVCPTWWPSRWVDRVREGAATRSVKTVVRQRADVLTVAVPGTPTVVEIAPDIVAVWRAGDVVAADSRQGESADIVNSVAVSVGTATSILVDAPVAVTGAAELARAISERLRINGAAVTTMHPDRILAATREPHTPEVSESKPPQRSRRRIAAPAASAAAVALLCAGLTLASGAEDYDMTAAPTTLLVEGRVALKVPALWAVHRITSGAGSARVEARAPDNATAVLVTQSQVPRGETLISTSAMLRRALDDQQTRVFSHFNSDDRRADRPAVTYRELREGRQTDWAVFVDDTVRIGVGCQSAPGSELAVRYACEEAIRSAHALF
jgi:type VII secretion-associated protein (TIGR03931 family)